MIGLFRKPKQDYKLMMVRQEYIEYLTDWMTIANHLKTDISDMTGDENQFEVNQIINAKGRIGPLRDTFFLVMSGDIISTDAMGTFINSCFNPSNLQ